MISKTKSFFRDLVQRRSRAFERRRIRAQDPSKPSLAKLSQELLDLVTEYLYRIDPQSVNSLALVCLALHHTARDVQHRNISLNLSWFASGTAVDRLNSMVRNGLLPVIRTLHVQAPPHLEARPKTSRFSSRSKSFRDPAAVQVAAWHQVCELVPQMTGLRDLHWECGVIPDPLLAHLRNTPRLLLHLAIVDLHPGTGTSSAWVEKHAFLRELPARLAGTQGFSSLRLEVVYGFSDSGTKKLIDEYLRPILFSSPRLRKLSLNIGPPTSGCTARNYAVMYTGFGLSPRDTLPALEELEMLAYPWGVLSTVRGSPPGGWPFDTGGYRDVFHPEMQNWARLLDWSRLRRLHLNFDSAELAAHLAPYLTALEDLEFGSELHGALRLAIPALLAGLRSPSLKSITLPTLPDFTTWTGTLGIPVTTPRAISLITAHATTLRTLSIHETPLQPTDLALLSTTLTNLSTLTLVCAREADAWPRDALTTIASFPSLSSLTLWFSLGEGKVDKPFLTFSAAETISALLREAGAARLRRLRLNSGLPVKSRLGFYVSVGPELPMGRMRTGFEVGGYGGGGEGVVSCVKLGWERNQRLRRVARGEVGMTRREERDLEFLVALRGPMGYDEWLEWRKPVVGS